MSWFDAALLVLIGLYAYTGWVNGFVSNFFSGMGLVLGFVLGIVVAPLVFGERSGGPATGLMALALVFAVAGVGNLIGLRIGHALRIRQGPGRTVDAVAGAAFGTAVVMAVSWAVGYAVSTSTLPYISTVVRESVVLARVDSVMPTRAGDLLRSFTDTLTTDVFPQYLDPFQAEVIPSTQSPDESVLRRRGVRAARDSVVTVRGEAECRRTVEGSGFVIAADRVMTNTHVVAGVSAPIVTLGDRRLRATTVVFDEDLDLAVLAVPGMNGRPLRFDTRAEEGDPAAVLGFPENGPFDARAARIRARIDLRGPDIRGRGRVARDVFSIRALVRSGNSGGPLVSEDGDVVGVIFAASISDEETGYAVTAAEAFPVAREGIRAADAVGTGACT